MRQTISNANESSSTTTPPRRDLTDKLRVLLHAKPLFDLKRSDSLRSEDLRHYDTLVLAMKIWDMVVENMGLETEVGRSDVLPALQPTLEKMDAAAEIEPDFQRHQLVVSQVIGALCNDDQSRRPFKIQYQDFDDHGDIVPRYREFHLLMDFLHPSGKTVLRLTSAAINLYLRCWSLDIEDEQAATNAVVLSQLNRGKFDEAADSARKAKIMSLRFGEKVEAILRDTRRDVKRVDWNESVPNMLKEALAHIKWQTDSDANILESATFRLEQLDEEDGAKAVVEVRRLIEECQQRHFDLHGKLMNARPVFLDEQERQGFQVRQVRFMPSLANDVLYPLLADHSSTSAMILEKSAASLIGAVPPSLLSLKSLVQWQLMPRQQVASVDSPIEAPDLVDRSMEVLRYDDELRSEGDKLLDDLDEPTLLSDILDMIGQWNDDVELQEYVVFSVLHSFAPEPDADTIVKAEFRRGRRLATSHFYGDEVLVIPKVETSINEEVEHGE